MKSDISVTEGKMWKRIDGMFVVQYNRERENQTFNCKMEEHMDMLSGNINKTEVIYPLPNARATLDKKSCVITSTFEMNSTCMRWCNEIWRNGKGVGDTEVTSGIRQGCTGSPQLFVMAVNIVINSIVESKLDYRDEGFYIPVLFYADDGLLLAQSCEEAEEMIRMVVEVAENVDYV